MTTDVGQHQMWAANRLRFDRPRRWITSGGLGTMGFGLPAALGAQAAHPDATVVCVSGEGSILLNVQELATGGHRGAAGEGRRARQPLARHGPPAAGPVLGGRRMAVDLGGTPDLPALARSFGIAAYEADEPTARDAIDATLAEPGPALLRIGIEQEADCLPMFRPGGPAREMIGYTQSREMERARRRSR